MPGRVFVTGGSGFVGSAVIEELVARNYSVNALVDRRPIRVPGENSPIQASTSSIKLCDLAFG